VTGEDHSDYEAYSICGKVTAACCAETVRWITALSS
jgi:hypothetical protein